MVEQALSLANDCNDLQELRMHQRQKMVKSDLIDHAGLAVSLENAFRSWWLRWLQKQDWPIETKQTWHQTSTRKIGLFPTITNSVCRRLPLWLGELTEAERQEREGRGQRVVRLKNLQAWGEPFRCLLGRSQTRFWLGLKMEPVTRASVGGSIFIRNWCGSRRAARTTMKLLLVHQNFPGQFRDLGPALCDRGHELKAIGSSKRPTDPRIEVLRYEHNPRERSGIHPHSMEVDEWVCRSEQVGELAMSLKQRGWAPDVMLAHPGWGEALLLRQVFPSTPLVIWPELWLRPEHLCIDPIRIT